jgi:acetyl-CoA C-acetyltransferase
MALHATKAGGGSCLRFRGVETVSRFRFGSSDYIPGQDPALILNPLFADAEARAAERAAGNAPSWHDPRDDGFLPDAYIAMGQTAENVAQLKGISRREQDEYAALSQNRAEQATNDGSSPAKSLQLLPAAARS